MNKGARLIFMGTPPLAATVLKRLIPSSLVNLIAVYSQPPRPANRGYHLTKSPVHELAEDAGLPVFTPLDFKDPEAIKQFQELKPDIVVVVAYGLILPPTILSVPPLGCFNIHTSLLPKWRGAAPIQWAILAGDHESGVTLMKMDEGLDTGPMVHVKKTPLEPTITSQQLHDRLAILGADTLMEVLPKILSREALLISQPLEGATYAHKIKKEDGHLSWQLSSKELDRRIRALNPWPGTWVDFQDQALKILEAEPVKNTTQAHPGTLIDEHLTIACGEGALRLIRVQRPGKKPVSAQEFLNGFPLKVGEILK